jgi:hypothetical protein
VFVLGYGFLSNLIFVGKCSKQTLDQDKYKHWIIFASKSVVIKTCEVDVIMIFFVTILTIEKVLLFMPKLR